MDDLRKIICLSCKTKLASSNVSVPTIAGPSDQSGSLLHLRLFLHSSRRVFQGLQRSRLPADNAQPRSPSNSLAVPQNNNTTSEPVAHNLSTSASTRGSGQASIISPKPKAEPPTWSVVYHPTLKRVLDLELANVITYESPVSCVKMSPDGLKIAIGLDERENVLEGIENGIKYLVSFRVSLFKIWTDMFDSSVFVDRYLKEDDSSGRIFCLQFSPDGQLLATGTCGGQIKVGSLKMGISINLVPLCLDMGYHSKANASHVQRTHSQLSAASLSLLMVVLLSLDPTIDQFAYGMYGMDHQRSCQ